jgi:hypothetical protein
MLSSKHFGRASFIQDLALIKLSTSRFTSRHEIISQGVEYIPEHLLCGSLTALVRFFSLPWFTLPILAHTTLGAIANSLSRLLFLVL